MKQADGETRRMSPAAALLPVCSDVARVGCSLAGAAMTSRRSVVRTNAASKPLKPVLQRKTSASPHRGQPRPSPGGEEDACLGWERLCQPTKGGRGRGSAGTIMRTCESFVFHTSGQGRNWKNSHEEE